MISRRLRLPVTAGLLAATAACTEDSIVAVDSDTAPGFSTPTIELFLEAGELPAWRDTTFWGFTLPSTVSYGLWSDDPGLRARPLGRFSTIPDSVFVDTARVAIDRFESAVLSVSVDTAASTLAASGAEVAVWSLTRDFDADEVTWVDARAGEPWTTPGGDLGMLLGTDSVRFAAEAPDEMPDSVRIALPLDPDSLLSAWREQDGEPGLILTLAGPGTRLRVNSVSLVAGAVPEGIDTVVMITRGLTPGAFVYDPATPDPSTRLRLGGLPGARFYVDFALPDSVGPIALRGATINRATLEFRPTGSAPEPFALGASLASQAVRLLADPFEFGEKTPIGAPLGQQRRLEPDSLASGIDLTFDITTLISLWSQVAEGSAPPLRVGIVPIPENREFGFWEFFSREDAPGLRPVVHLLFTPNPSFLLP